MKNRILEELRSDCWQGVPGPGDPYEWAFRGWMDAAEREFSSGIYLPFQPTPEEARSAARVVLRLGQIKGVRTAAEVGSPRDIINAGFGLELIPASSSTREEPK